MTPTDKEAGGLGGLRDRLLGGVHESLDLSRRAVHRESDESLLAGWPPDKFDALQRISDSSWKKPEEPQRTIDNLVAEFSGNRQLLVAVVFSPHLLLRRVVKIYGSSDLGLANSWITLCWIAEAAWETARGDLNAAAGYLPGDAELFRLLAARTRFLVLSEPMRHRTKTSGTLWEVGMGAVPGGSVLNRVFGDKSWLDFVDRCREARREWQDYLDAFQSGPLLRQARPEGLEEELRTLVFAGARPGPLVLSTEWLTKRASPTAEDRTVIADAADYHLLPRFAVWPVIRLGLYDDRPGWQLGRRLLAAAVAASSLASVGCAAALLVYPAVWLALVSYSLLAGGTALLTEGWSMMWLLRMPAASAVGVAALISFLPGGWLAQASHGRWALTASQGWAAAALLTAVSLGYLLVEVRNHAVASRAVPQRVLLVGVIGLVHALMVAMIGLVIVAPAVATSGSKLGALWSHPGYGHAGAVIAIAAAWCLAVGVFSQILWDDRPITAPLAHLSWRKEK